MNCHTSESGKPTDHWRGIDHVCMQPFRPSASTASTADLRPLRPDLARRPHAGRRRRARAYSDINYKDALAATGTAPILRKYPLAGGIDLAGEVVSSTDPRYTPGQKVLVTGCGLSETQDGGYSEYARLQGDWVIPAAGRHDRLWTR